MFLRENGLPQGRVRFGHVSCFSSVVRGGGPVLSRSLGGPLSQWPLTPIRLQEVFPERHVVLSMPARTDLALYRPRSLLRFVTAAEWGPHAERLRRPTAVFPDVATSPSSPPAAATGPAPLSPAPVTPAMAWLEAGCKSPGRSSSEGEDEGDRRGLAQPPPPTRQRWADASEAEGVVEVRPPKRDLVPRGSVATSRVPETQDAPKKRELVPRGSVATCPRLETQDELDHAKEWWPEVASSFCFVKRRASNFESRPPDCGGNRSLPQIRTQRSSIRLLYGDSLGFRIRILLLCEKMRLLAATLEDPIFGVHPVFALLFQSKMDGSKLREAMTMSVEGNRDWGRCVVPGDHPILQGSSILHLVAGQRPSSGYEPDNYEVWLDIICDEVFSQTIVKGLSAASCTMCWLVR